MGYNVPEEPNVELPDLNQYVGRIEDAFIGYLARELPALGSHMDEERVEGILDMVADHMHAEGGPDMVAILDMAGSLDLPDDVIGQWMHDIKSFMNGLIMEILNDSGMPQAQLNGAVDGLNSAMDQLSAQEYMMMIAAAFSGKGDMGALDDFINTSFELPDLFDVKMTIFNVTTEYMQDNLPRLMDPSGAAPLLDEE
jgi:hypothetical protein